MGANEIEVMLDPQDGLEENQKYMYTVSAVNGIGTTTLHQNGDDKCFCKYIYWPVLYNDGFLPLLHNNN